MKKTYSAPAIVEFGSIADCTFATPAVTGVQPTKANIDAGLWTPAASTGGGSFVCAPDAGSNAGQGGKNSVTLQCDMYGEFSHS